MFILYHFVHTVIVQLQITTKDLIKEQRTKRGEIMHKRVNFNNMHAQTSLPRFRDIADIVNIVSVI